jgi:hypothetical protein
MFDKNHFLKVISVRLFHHFFSTKSLNNSIFAVFTIKKTHQRLSNNTC